MKAGSGKAIGYTNADEWVEYTVNVAETGSYTCQVVASAGVDGAKILLQRVKGTTKTQLFTIDVPKTGSDWNTYRTLTVPTSSSNSAPKAISLTAGEQVFRVTFKGNNCNLDKIIFKSIPTGISEVENYQPDVEGSTYNLSGQKVDNGYRGIVINNGRKVLRK